MFAFLFADVAVTPERGALIGLAALTAFLGSKIAFQKDTAIEQRRKAASRLAGQLRQYGFKRLPRFVENYSVGDYSGMVHELASAAEDLSDAKVAATELDGVFQYSIEAKAKDPETRAALYDKIDKLKVAYPPEVKQEVKPAA